MVSVGIKNIVSTCRLWDTFVRLENDIIAELWFLIGRFIVVVMIIIILLYGTNVEKRITPIEQIGNRRTKRKISFKDLQVQIPAMCVYTEREYKYVYSYIQIGTGHRG